MGAESDSAGVGVGVDVDVDADRVVWRQARRDGMGWDGMGWDGHDVTETRACGG